MILVTPTGKTTDGKAMKCFSNTILLLHIYCFEGDLSGYKIDKMVNNHSNTYVAVDTSDFKKYMLISLTPTS